MILKAQAWKLSVITVSACIKPLLYGRLGVARGVGTAAYKGHQYAEGLQAALAGDGIDETLLSRGDIQHVAVHVPQYGGNYAKFAKYCRESLRNSNKRLRTSV